MKRFSFDELRTADLHVDAVYEGGRFGNAGDDPLSRLIGVSNQGGFRYLGSVNVPKLIVLTSSFSDPDWPDHVDHETGIVTYYGDNKHPGRGLHETPRHGNELLRKIFNLLHSTPQRRIDVPPILIFGNTGTYRDVVFLGLAAPGSPSLSTSEDLTAIWKVTKGQRFQNYRAIFTILNAAKISRQWLEDVKAGKSPSAYSPDPWKLWVQKGFYRPLTAENTVEYRNKSEQIPSDKDSLRILDTIYTYFKDNPVAFEACAAKITQLMDNNFLSFNLTRPSRDGGRDATGQYRVGNGSSAIFVDFSLEAKCYDKNNSVGVKEVSRLISRLRHRQFGVLVTTSFLHLQAYKELKEDQHPVVIVSGKDIVDILRRAGLSNVFAVKQWLEANFSLR